MNIVVSNVLFVCELFALTGLLLWAGFYGMKVRRETREQRH